MSGPSDHHRPSHPLALAAGIFVPGLVLLVGFVVWVAQTGHSVAAAPAAPAAPAAEAPAAKTTAAKAPAAKAPAAKAPAATAPAAKAPAPAAHDHASHAHGSSAEAPEMDMTPKGKRAEPYGTHPLASNVADGVRTFRLTARTATVSLDGKTSVEAWTYDGQLPGPLVRVRVGEHIRIVFTNRLPEPTTVHWHGLDVPLAQDGVPGLSQKPVQPGETFTYSFTVPNQPGVYMYHPHFNTLEQQGRGMYGAFVVDPRTGPDPKVQEAIQVISEMQGHYLINGRSFPATDAYVVERGRPVLIRMLNVGEMPHPMHLHGQSFDIVAENGSPVARQHQQRKFTQVLFPGETYDVRYTPDRRSGAWLFHCHILSHVTSPEGQDTGMITVLETA